MKKSIAIMLALAMLASLSLTAFASEGAERYTALVNAKANGYSLIDSESNTHLLARAVIPDEYTAVDHWEGDGKVLDTNGRVWSCEFDSADYLTIAAVLRPIKSVTCINCYLQFPDSNGNAAGDKYTEFYFEYEYSNPVTNESCAGGYITACITADVPAGMKVDYWKINGVDYKFDDLNVTALLVGGLDETTVYEVVLTPGSGTSSAQIVTNNKVTPADRPYIPDDYPEGHGPEDIINPLIPPETVENPSDGHEHDLRLSPANSSYHQWTCAKPNCDYAEYGPHTFTGWSNNGGGHSRTCTMCGYTASDGHSMTGWIDYGGNHVNSCTVCGYSESGSHNMQWAYYERDSYGWETASVYICSVCGHTEKYDVIN